MRRVVCGIVLAAAAAQACEPGFHRADDGSCVPAVVGYSPEPEPGPGLAPEPEPGLVPEPEPEPEPEAAAAAAMTLEQAQDLLSKIADCEKRLDAAVEAEDFAACKPINEELGTYAARKEEAQALVDGAASH